MPILGEGQPRLGEVEGGGVSQPIQALIGWDPVGSERDSSHQGTRLGQEDRTVSAPGPGPVVRAGIVGIVQAALGGSEHALRLHHEHVVEVPHQHGQQGQERQAVAKAAEGAAYGEGQPVYQPARARRENRQ